MIVLILRVKNPPAMWETWIRSLGWEDPLERRERQPTPGFWPGEFHELYSPQGRKELDTTERLLAFHSISTLLAYLSGKEHAPLLVSLVTNEPT